MGEALAKYAKGNGNGLSAATKTVSRDGKTYEQRYWVRGGEIDKLSSEGPTTSERMEIGRQARKLPTYKAAKEAGRKLRAAIKSKDGTRVRIARVKYEEAKVAHWKAREAMEKSQWAKH
jgi:hypothetical protein